MEKKCDDERWALAKSTENTVGLQEIGGEETEEDEETLSLSDLPLIQKKEGNSNRSPRETQIPDDFDFCSQSKESEMCAADEVFFQGQILPLRHSVSSEKGSLLQYCKTRSITRSDSMDHYYSGPGRLVSSRSSSISSHQSSSSGSSVGPKLLPARNRFHSHPSPSPRIHFPSKKHIITSNNRNFYNWAKKPSAWNIFRLGILATPPEIAFQDLKPRFQSSNSTNCRNFGSRNSTDTNSSSISSGNNSSNRKKKNTSRSLLVGCKCSVDAVDTVPSRVVIIKRSASASAVEALGQESADAMQPAKLMKKQAAGRKHLSHHRTFEWLKQLSLEDAADEA